MQLLHSFLNRFLQACPHAMARVVFFILMIVSLLSVDSVLAKPRKVSSVEWQTNWIHPGAITIRSSDRKALTTKLPNKNAIQDDYLSSFRIILGGGQNTVVTISPMSYQNTISCPSLTANKGMIKGSCRAKRDGLKNFPRNTKVTLKVKTPGNAARYLYWNIKPRRSTVIPKRPPATQFYEIGLHQISEFVKVAKSRNYQFRVIPQKHYRHPPFDNALTETKPLLTSSSKGYLIQFGPLFPIAPGGPNIESLNPNDGMVVSMFHRSERGDNNVATGSLNKDWTFVSAKYVGESGENCQRQIQYEHPGTNRIFHQFSVNVDLFKHPFKKTCSKLWLHSIKLKGPKGKDPLEDALREVPTRRR